MMWLTADDDGSTHLWSHKPTYCAGIWNVKAWRSTKTTVQFMPLSPHMKRSAPKIKPGQCHKVKLVIDE